jgi:hypothetical protein
LIRQDFTDAPTRALLVNGVNTLAAVGLNSSLSSNDLTLKVVLELTGGTDTPVDVPEVTAPTAVLSAGPNPFAARVAVQLRMERPGDASLRVWDAAGRLVREVHSRQLPAGLQTLEWDGRDAQGANTAPGVYLYRIEAPGLVRSGKWTRSASTLR